MKATEEDKKESNVIKGISYILITLCGNIYLQHKGKTK